MTTTENNENGNKNSLYEDLSKARNFIIESDYNPRIAVSYVRKFFPDSYDKLKVESDFSPNAQCISLLYSMGPLQVAIASKLEKMLTISQFITEKEKLRVEVNKESNDFLCVIIPGNNGFNYATTKKDGEFLDFITHEEEGIYKLSFPHYVTYNQGSFFFFDGIKAEPILEKMKSTKSDENYLPIGIVGVSGSGKSLFAKSSKFDIKTIDEREDTGLDAIKGLNHALYNLSETNATTVIDSLRYYSRAVSRNLISSGISSALISVLEVIKSLDQHRKGVTYVIINPVNLDSTNSQFVNVVSIVRSSINTIIMPIRANKFDFDDMNHLFKDRDVIKIESILDSISEDENIFISYMIIDDPKDKIKFHFRLSNLEGTVCEDFDSKEGFNAAFVEAYKLGGEFNKSSESRMISKSFKSRSLI